MITPYCSYVITYQTANSFSNYFKLFKDQHRLNTRCSYQFSLNVSRKIQKHMGQTLLRLKQLTIRTKEPKNKF